MGLHGDVGVEFRYMEQRAEARKTVWTGERRGSEERAEEAALDVGVDVNEGANVA